MIYTKNVYLTELFKINNPVLERGEFQHTLFKAKSSSSSHHNSKSFLLSRQQRVSSNYYLLDVLS